MTSLFFIQPNENEMYAKLNEYASAKNMKQTLATLPYAKKMHEGQFRKGKDRVPYICHPLIMANHALALGLDDDDFISAVLLHDVCEDCGVTPNELPVDDYTKTLVGLLTKDSSFDHNSKTDLDNYYATISKNVYASLIKILDRCHNVSGMAECFSKKRIGEYISETEEYIYPLFDEIKKYPEHENRAFLLKYHIDSVLFSIKELL